MPNTKWIFEDLFKELNKPKMEKEAERLALAQLIYYYPDMFEHRQRVWHYEYDENLNGFWYLDAPPILYNIITADYYKKHLEENK
jgi:hypothetical protein